MSNFDEKEKKLGPRWYVAHTYSGYENKVKTNLEKIVENRGLGNLIFDCVIPVEIVTEKDGDTEKDTETKILPSYVLVKMIMTDESWHVVRNIRGVTGFVGPGSHPVPLTEEEVDSLNIEKHTVTLSFSVGDNVVVAKGIFAGNKGRVLAIDDDLKKVTVAISTGKREMPVQLDSSDVKADKN